MHRTVLATALATAFLLPAIALAQGAAAGEPEKTDGGLEFSGYLDVSYNRLSGNGLFVSGVPNRVFDVERNDLRTRQLALTLAKQPKEGLGGLLNVTLGKDANVIAAYDTNPNNGTTTGKRDYWDVTQAFLQYAAGPWTVIGGKFVTSAGAEVINSTANPNYSRSILFGYAIPFTHTGFRATYALGDTLTITGGINNGWDDFKDTNDSKTGELGFMYAANKTFMLSAMAHFGKERVGGLVGSGPEGQRNLIDVVGTINATDKLSFILNYDYATQANASTVAPSGASKAKWRGLAGYANYQFNDQWRLSFRAEYFDDKDGYRTGLVQKWKEATLTLAYLPPAIKNLELRAEVRGDRSNQAAFLDKDGATAKKSQSSFGLEAIYKF